MQFLVFHLGKDRYGLNTEHVIRILPFMELKQMPKTPDYVAGLMNYHGDPIPVIDLCALTFGTPCNAHFDTRILLVDYCADDQVWHLLGLIAERVTGIENLDASAFFEPGVSTVDAPFLGKVTASDGAILQLINIEQLLTEDVRRILFPRRSPASP